MTRIEEDLPKRPGRLLTPPPLDELGVAELDAYITDLEAEIARVKAKIATKDAHKAAAAAFFKGPG